MLSPTEFNVRVLLADLTKVISINQQTAFVQPNSDFLSFVSDPNSPGLEVVFVTRTKQAIAMGSKIFGTIRLAACTGLTTDELFLTRTTFNHSYFFASNTHQWVEFEIYVFQSIGILSSCTI
ncbi:unnamed protein product [Dicrocoelium dendriticum]|nr:unnamed protein product [Dicrocoelium dendriticum]